MLRVGKLKESVYKRSVEKQLHNDKSFQPMSVHTVTVDGWTLAADRVICNMINAFTASGSTVRQMMISVNMPEETEEPVFRKFTARLGQLCKEHGIWVSVEEARVLKTIQKPLITVMGLGEGIVYPEVVKDIQNPASKDQNRPVTADKKRLEADREIIVVGSIAREGAAVLAHDFEAQLKERFAGFYIEKAKQLYDQAAMPMVRDILVREEAIATSLGEGGIFAALWDMAAAGKVGLDIDLSAIPIRQHTVEVCEFFNLNPYMLLSGGCMLIVARHGASVVSSLDEAGYHAAVIGRTTSGNDRIIRYDDEIRYLEPPKTDEMYKVHEMYRVHEM